MTLASNRFSVGDFTDSGPKFVESPTSKRLLGLEERCGAPTGSDTLKGRPALSGSAPSLMCQVFVSGSDERRLFALDRRRGHSGRMPQAEQAEHEQQRGATEGGVGGIHRDRAPVSYTHLTLPTSDLA